MTISPPPRNHHYIPRFWLNRWCGDDGKLVRFDKPYNEIVSRRVFPSQVGFLPDLYKVQGCEPHIEQQLETAFMQKIDNVGARALLALEQLESDVPTDAVLRSNWTMFLLTIMHRNPESWGALNRAIIHFWREPLPEVEQRYHQLKSDSDPESYTEWAEARDPNIAGKSVSNVIPSAIISPDSGQFIVNMNWTVIDVSEARIELLLSDRPIAITNGLDKEGGHLAMPLTPFKLLLVCRDESTHSEIKKYNAKNLVENYNRVVVQNARRFVVSSNTKQTRFIKNRFGTDPFPSWSETIASRLNTAEPAPPEWLG